jgi:hypothetical protein
VSTDYNTQGLLAVVLTALLTVGNSEKKLIKFNLDELAKSQETFFSVIPAKAGIQRIQAVLDSRLRGRDGFSDFLRSHQP